MNRRGIHENRFFDLVDQATEIIFSASEVSLPDSVNLQQPRCERVDEPFGSPQLRGFSFTTLLQGLVERLYLPAIGIPVKLLGRSVARVCQQIAWQLPVNLPAAFRSRPLAGMTGCQRQVRADLRNTAPVLDAARRIGSTTDREPAPVVRAWRISPHCSQALKH